MALVKAQVKFSDKETTLEVPAGTTVKMLLDRLEPKWHDNAIVLVNGKIANADDPLNAADRIVVLPLLAGG